MTQITFTEEATQDLENIYDYIAQDSIAAADRHGERLRKRWLALLDQPRIGHKQDELKPGLRSITEGNYIIFYRILVDGVQIIRVLHRSRDIEQVFADCDV